jgi:hypothetical protein
MMDEGKVQIAKKVCELCCLGRGDYLLLDSIQPLREEVLVSYFYYRLNGVNPVHDSAFQRIHLKPNLH